jgi:acetyl esterase/lipase
MPYVSKGWCVISANYRLLNETGLIGMIGDARSALNWIYENAGKYKFDTTKIIVSGESSGSHMALMTGFLTNDDLYQQDNTKRTRLLKVAGIINWYGSVDLVQASKNWTPALYKLAVGNGEYADSILKITSPINFITSTSPPVITIHGDQDKTALYSQALLLHSQLKKTGVKNYLLTIPGKKHGNFDGFEMTHAQNEIWKFLHEIGIE